MHIFTLICLSALLLCHSSRGFQFRNLLGNQKQFSNILDDIGPAEPSTSVQDSSERSNSSDYGIFNSTSEYRIEGNSGVSLITGNVSEIDPSAVNINQLLEYSTSRTESESVTNHSKIEVSSAGSNNESHSNNTDSAPKSQVITSGSIETGKKSTLVLSVTPNSTSNGSSLSSIESNEEQEGVVLGKPFHTENGNSTSSSEIKTLYQRAMGLISDTYTLSILLPVAAGIVFASTIILTIAICRCLRRRCRRRRLRRKTLPDSVKNLRPSDRARLLAESSDEEF